MTAERVADLRKRFLSDDGRWAKEMEMNVHALSGTLVYPEFNPAVHVVNVDQIPSLLTRYMAKELGARRIGVNTIAPGAIETDFAGGVVRDNADMNAAIASQTALGRVGLPDDIGEAVSMLLSDEAHWISGQRVEVSGGMFL